jgi:hypothetical protein
MLIRRALAALMIALVFCARPTSTQAQQSLPPPVNLPVPVVLQQTQVWCWLASSEMVIRYLNNGFSYTQCQMLEKGYGLPPGACCGNPGACMVTAQSWSAIQAVLAFGGLKGTIRPALSANDLYLTLRRNHPVIAQISEGGQGTHAIVLRAMRFAQVIVGYYPNGLPAVQTVAYVAVNDPLNIFPQEAEFSRLSSVWMDSLEVEKNTMPSASPPSAAPTQATSGGFCRAVNQVLASGASKSSVKGAKHDRDDGDDADVYDGTVAIPGTEECSVWVKDDGIRPYYYCDISVDKKDCEATEDKVRAFGRKLKDCLTGWHFYMGDKRRVHDYKLHGEAVEDQDDGPAVSARVSDFNDHCDAHFSID